MDLFGNDRTKEKNGVTPPRPDKEAIRNMILRHSKLQIQYRGEFAGMREMRKHVAWYTKGLTGAADLRRRVNETETLDELMMLWKNYENLQQKIYL